MSERPTSSPEAVDVTALLRFISRAERLEALPRTGWIVCGVDRPESVASHSYMVTLIALWIADHVEEEVDTERMLRMALFHDIGEAMLTDLPGPVKAMIGRSVVADAEARACETLLDEACPGWSEYEARYRAQNSLEARIVKASDRLQMFAKALQYDHQRRGDVARFLDIGPQDDFGIPLVGRIFEALRSAHDEGSWFTSDFD